VVAILPTWRGLEELAFLSDAALGQLPCLRATGEKSRSLTMSALSSTFLSTLLYALIEERHFALVDRFARFQPGLAWNRSGQELGPTQPSLRSRTAIKIRFFELPYLLGAGCPIITSVLDCTLMCGARPG
jgi:hypothetical protein